MEKLTIIKVGGKVVEEEASLHQLLEDFSKLPGKKILVHGGGRSATAMASKLGVDTKMVNGRRITDLEMLKVVTMVYGGLVNKNIVAGLQANNCNAIGLTGADMNVIQAVKRPVVDIDYGYAGDVTGVNAVGLKNLLDQEVTPVMAPLTHNQKGSMLNTNADTIASEVAIALSEFFDTELVFCFEKNGVLEDADNDNSVIPVLTPENYEEYKSKEVIKDGMIPKLDNGFAALKKGVSSIRIVNSGTFIQPGSGTTLKL